MAKKVSDIPLCNLNVKGNINFPILSTFWENVLIQLQNNINIIINIHLISHNMLFIKPNIENLNYPIKLLKTNKKLYHL